MNKKQDINELEAEFLNNTQKDNNKTLKILDIFIIILSIICNLIYYAFDLFCTLIEWLFYLDLGVTTAKTVYKRKRKKRW